MAVRRPHSDHHSSRPHQLADEVSEILPQLILFDAVLAMSRETSIRYSAFAKGVVNPKQHFVAAALLQLILLEPAHAGDGRPDECGLASVYSSRSEATASGEDTRAKNLTAAHRSLPFETMVEVENQENGRSAVVRITDRGHFVSGRIINVSQVAAHELGFTNLTKVCLKILSIPENPPIQEK